MKRFLTLGLFPIILLVSILGGCQGVHPAPQSAQPSKVADLGQPPKAEAQPPKAEASGSDVLNSGKRVIFGFYTGTGREKSAAASLLNHLNALDEVAFFWYTFDKSGRVKRLDNVDLSVKEAARKGGAKVYALVHNLGGQGFAPQLTHQVLADPAIRSTFVKNLVALATQENWDGIAIDIEKTLPSDRTSYSAFVSELHSALQAKNKILNVSVPAKYQDYRDDLWSGAYDYAAIGKAADQAIIMTYEEHGLGTTQGPIASQGWVNRVVSYATGKIPREKIIMGLPVYGSDWASNQPTLPKSMSAAQAADLAKKHGVNILYDEAQQAPHYTFTLEGIRHEVYFEDVRSLTYKLNIAKKNQLHGVAIWRLGIEEPSLWTDVLKNYNTGR